MGPRGWITVGWLFIVAMAGLAIAAITLVLGGVSVGHACIQLAGVTSLGTGAGLLIGLICAVGAGVAFFSGLACFFWGALLDFRQQLARVLEHLGSRR